MAKEPTAPQPGAKNGTNGGTEAGEGPAPQLRVIGQYIKDLSFESPNAPQSLRDPGENPNIQVEINVAANQLDQNVFECAIDFKVKASSTAMTIYSLEMVYAGAFELQNFPSSWCSPSCSSTARRCCFPSCGA
jgi:preprotein translocase subunit SecB